jgi:endonuclease/exonuclease/phosphatase family metal-dependent hydrolase
MSTALRIATFNLENLDDRPGDKPTLAERLPVLRAHLLRLRADVLCLQEVHGQEQPGQPRRLTALDALLQGTDYAGYFRTSTLTTTNQPYDQRNLVVLSRFPVLQRQQINQTVLDTQPQYRKVTALPPEVEAKAVVWERPILYVQLDLGQGRTLHVLNVHLKSKLPARIEGQMLDTYQWRTVSGWAEGYFLASMKRVGQALEARLLIDQIFDTAGEDALLTICGDFNADTNDVPVSAIRGRVEDTRTPRLRSRVMIPCEASVPDSRRYTLLHEGRGAMLDHILASQGLLPFYRGTEIHNETLPDESTAFNTDVLFPESDHAPVVAEFILP